MSWYVAGEGVYVVNVNLKGGGFIVTSGDVTCLVSVDPILSVLV
jgi:hypothetical protein